jgi:hypothetical protein
MPNLCNVALVAAGPSQEVRRFVRAAMEQKASRKRPKRVARRRKRRPYRVLSFGSLLPLIRNASPDVVTETYGTPAMEPLDPHRDRPNRLAPGLIKRYIRQQPLHIDPDPGAIVLWFSGDPNLKVPSLIAEGAEPPFFTNAAALERHQEGHWADQAEGGSAPALGVVGDCNVFNRGKLFGLIQAAPLFAPTPSTQFTVAIALAALLFIVERRTAPGTTVSTQTSEFQTTPIAECRVLTTCRR